MRLRQKLQDDTKEERGQTQRKTYLFIGSTPAPMFQLLASAEARCCTVDLGLFCLLQSAIPHHDDLTRFRGLHETGPMEGAPPATAT